MEVEIVNASIFAVFSHIILYLGGDGCNFYEQLASSCLSNSRDRLPHNDADSPPTNRIAFRGRNGTLWSTSDTHRFYI